jgi:hypothetical protein
MTDVLFQSDYWFASTYSQRVETIQNFIEADGQRTLIIIDTAVTNVRQIMDTLRDEWELPFVILVLGHPDKPFGVFEYNPIEGRPANKIIYQLESLDALALNAIKRSKPILAIFT